MKIALLSYAFSPGVGGIETVSQLLVDGLRAKGHVVRVLTYTARPDGIAEEGIVRHPSAGELLATLRWADAVVQSNVSMQLAWPLSLGLVRRPWVVVNHTPISRPSGERTWRDRLKLASLRRARVYAVSEYLRSVTLATSRVMRNPYDIASFHLGAAPAAAARAHELLFVGRIVRAKGLDVLVEALHLLKQRGLQPHLSVAGDGDERAAIAARVVQLGLQDQVTWLGVLRGVQLGDAMRQHTVVVVPSRPEPPEALPLVPLEAVASGCVVIASRQGGLPESVGPCGLLVAPEDPQALADAIFELLATPELQQRLRDAAPAHLKPFHPETVVADYEAALREAAAARQ
jgi:glycosyltransferase involved in cell wall biosynthesis